MPRTIFVPPGGFQGFAEQTIAVKTLVSTSGKSSSRKKARTTGTTARRKPARARTRSPGPGRRRKPARTKPINRKPRRGKKPQRLVKGSAAAKRHMAKLRRMRKR